jgi:hypothetical protein
MSGIFYGKKGILLNTKTLIGNNEQISIFIIIIS